ncbi:MAG: carbon starvation protein A, partial [Thermomicrobiales bacterium]
MSTLLVAIGAFVGYLIAYHTYGRWLARKVFNLDPQAEVPSKQLRDDVDFVPTKRQVIFGHHFTSIAGTGPIVGPAIAVFWGWLPALLWVIFGSIFVGAVHDLGALVISIRNRGQTVGEIAGRLISPRARVLFLTVLFMALTVVLAVFGLVIASIFAFYPQSVLPTWISLPLAIAIGIWVYKKGGGLLLPSIGALIIIYGSVWLGAYYLPVDMKQLFGLETTGPFPNAVIVWTFILLVYCFFASVLPVWVLLQPRDYINSHQLVIALVLLMAGLLVAGGTGKADLMASAPAVATMIPSDAPPIMPFLFITIACGACSGFHCLVSSGTTSKQLASETDAQYVAYGSMLLEGGLAVMVILACCAGVGMGGFELAPGSFVSGEGDADNPIVDDAGAAVTGVT